MFHPTAAALDVVSRSTDRAPGFARRLVESVGGRFERFRVEVRVSRELNEYTDRQLADIGLSRSDIPDIATGRYVR